MSSEEKFDAVAAAAGLPDYPVPDMVRGPGLGHATVGETRIRMVSDGAMTLPFGALCPDRPAPDAKALFGLAELPVWVRGEITSALLEIGNALVLIDAGAGRDWQGGAGRLCDHLAANAIAPETITHLVLTHLHPDHCWGALTSSGYPVFANARVYTGKAEAAFWSKPGLADKVHPAFRYTVDGAMRVLDAYRDRLHLVSEGDEVVPGLQVIDTPGHSPGHISLFLEDGDGLILTGDALVHEIVSFAKPDWPFGFDTDADMAVTSRRRLLNLAADQGHLMMGVHWSWPGIGHAEPDGQGFRFRPV